MRISKRARGLTLIELLMAVALTVVIVGIVAATTIQVQRTISATMEREDIARSARQALTDIENDLARIVPCYSAPLPFPQGSPPGWTPTVPSGPVRPLSIEAMPAYSSAPRTTPYTDRLRLFTTILDPGGTGVEVRGIVEYRVELNTSGLPWFKPQAGGGAQTTRLFRQIYNYAGASASSTTPGPAPMVLCDRLLSFQLEYVDNATGAFMDPSTNSASPSSTTGDIWVNGGIVTTGTPDFFTLSGDPGAVSLFNVLPVGSELHIETSKSMPGQVYLIRKKVGGTVLINDRIDPLSVSASNPDAMLPGGPNTGKVSAFVGPPAIRVTLTFAFGHQDTSVGSGGPIYSTARFSRTLAVPQ